MFEKVNFYFLSIFSFIFNIFFLITCNKFGDIFLEYLRILIYINFFICCFGSLQFYIKIKNNLIYYSIEKNLLLILITLFCVTFFYYLFKDLVLSLVFLTTVLSSLIIHFRVCSQTFLNKLLGNASYLFFISFIKFIIIFYSYSYKIDFLYSVITMNLLIIFLSIKFIRDIRITFNYKSSFNIISGINNLFGTVTTTLDKIYVVNILPFLSVTYYLVFKIASIYQFLTEIVYRKERFEITSGRYLENKKIVFFKFSILFFGTILFNLFVKLIIDFFQLYINIFLVDDFLKIIKENIDSISIFFIGFLINALSGLSYDQIYKKYLYKKVLNINIFLSVIFSILLISFGKNIIYISLIFLISQIIELIMINLKKKELNVK